MPSTDTLYAISACTPFAAQSQVTVDRLQGWDKFMAEESHQGHLQQEAGQVGGSRGSGPRRGGGGVQDVFGLHMVLHKPPDT